jgi:hypothetical protein
MRHNLIRNVLFFGLATLALSSCGTTETIKEVPVIETRTVKVSKPAPIVPSIDQIEMRDVDWIVVTPENVDAVFESLNTDLVLFGLTAEGYEALSLNLADLRITFQQYQEIIAIYRSSFN